MFEVTKPSTAFRVETNGRTAPCGHSVKYPSEPGGTTVALSTYDWAVAGAPQTVASTFTLIVPLNGCEPGGFRVSSTRHGAKLNSDNPPAAGGAKYPLMSITRAEVFVTNTVTAPAVPADTIAALAVVTPVGAFSVEAKGCVCPAGHVVRKPRLPCGTEV